MTSVWDAVIGQSHAVDRLRRAAADPTHAYLFVGPHGSTTEQAARAFAAAMITGTDDADTRDARLVMRGEHPDVIEVQRTGASIAKEQADAIEADSDWGMLEFAEITLLIEKPEDCEDDGAYQIPIGDKDYAIGKINVSKNAYRSTFKRLATFMAINQSTPVSGRVWSFSSEQITRGKYTWYNPTLVATKEETPEEVAVFTQKFSA